MVEGAVTAVGGVDTICVNASASWLNFVSISFIRWWAVYTLLYGSDPAVSIMRAKYSVM